MELATGRKEPVVNPAAGDRTIVEKLYEKRRHSFSFLFGLIRSQDDRQIFLGASPPVLDAAFGDVNPTFGREILEDYDT
jgi:hypothetical protein